jgi:hypothetical protein
MYLNFDNSKTSIYVQKKYQRNCTSSLALYYIPHFQEIKFTPTFFLVAYKFYGKYFYTYVYGCFWHHSFCFDIWIKRGERKDISIYQYEHESRVINRRFRIHVYKFYSQLKSTRKYPKRTGAGPINYIGNSHGEQVDFPSLYPVKQKIRLFYSADPHVWNLATREDDIKATDSLFKISI